MTSAADGLPRFSGDSPARELLSDLFAGPLHQRARLLQLARRIELRGLHTKSSQSRIIERGLYEEVERRPTRQTSVEVACAIEGLNDAYALANAANDDRVRRRRRSICAGLAYLLRLQCVADGTERERGGFGASLQDRTQRIDGAGHAASAFMKSVQNEIECDE